MKRSFKNLFMIYCDPGNIDCHEPQRGARGGIGQHDALPRMPGLPRTRRGNARLLKWRCGAPTPTISFAVGYGNTGTGTVLSL